MDVKNTPRAIFLHQKKQQQKKRLENSLRQNLKRRKEQDRERHLAQGSLPTAGPETDAE